MISQIPYKLRHTNREFNIKLRKIQRGWSKLKHPIPLK